ncbi:MULTISPECIES: hypothetical protein [unclassified Streptomyces]|uniref:hypothetical protein n=1 Tax=unclassified Streptomyces TaxID=2593676 RepID=UPI001BE88AF7|nr:MULTISPECIES: hypothetical protein [unclassified Streptomyces]MBT2406922.1 hypothetical protein [Streptomyces sp. ISL-21]MBT2613043.1 hypothetical protein [Streptomyces sp. ISL-87]
MTATETQTYTVIGLTLDVDRTELLIAAVVAGTVADQVELLATSEEDFTRWAEEFNAPDPDTAADLAYAFCRDFGYAEEGTAGEYLQRVLAEAGIEATRGAHPGSGCSWIAVPTPDGGEVLLTGQDRREAEVDYPLTDHAGWLACVFEEDGVEFTVLYDSHTPDLAADTAAAVAAVRTSVTTG